MLNTDTPLQPFRVALRASGVPAAYAGRMLATLGAEVVLLEPSGGSPLRREPPFLPQKARSSRAKSRDADRAQRVSTSLDTNGGLIGGEEKVSALFAYLCAGMRSAVAADAAEIAAHLGQADIFIDDTPLIDRAALGIDQAGVAAAYPRLIHVSALPFGAHGPKAGWKGEEITVLHASGEGYLLPNGLSTELFPERPPVKIHGHFTEMQGGVAAALGALSALWVRDEIGGQYVDVSSQDAGLAVGAFAIQRLGDGSVEHRVERSFRYGGVIECADGYVELLTLEQRQWHGLVELLGSPEWALDPALEDNLERSRRGPEINGHIRQWAISRRVDDVVREGQKLSVPLARYCTPADVLADPHERGRGLFQEVETGAGVVDTLVAPYHLDGAALELRGGPPVLGEYARVVA